MVSLDDGVSYTTEVVVLNAGEVRFTAEQQDGEVFKRVKLDTELLLDSDAFALLYPYEKTGGQRCTVIYIRQERECRGMWVPRWTGRFTPGTCEWDLDRCTVAVKPEVFDKYTCLLDLMDEKINVLDSKPYCATAVFDRQFDFGMVYGNWTRPDLIGGIGVNDTYEYEQYSRSGGMDIDPGLWTLDGSITYLGNGWTKAKTTFLNTDPLSMDEWSGLWYTYWRERVTTLCVDGDPVEPPGTGWELYSNDCGTNGTATWVRPPVIPYTFGDPVPGSCPGPYMDPLAPADPCDGQWILANPSPSPFGVDGYNPFPPPATIPIEACLYGYLGGTDDFAIPSPPLYICITSIIEQEYCRARRMDDTVQRMLDTYDCPTAQRVVSDFFEIEPDGTADGYSAGINYVTGQTNTVNHLLLLQASDAIDPDASEFATLGELSLKELLGWLRTMFQVYWDITPGGIFRLEHIDYFVQSQALDLTTAEALKANAMRNRYKHLSEAAPKRERMAYQAQRTLDFVGKDIVYPPACATAEVKQETVSVAADLAYINADPDAIGKDGFVMLACTEDDSGPDPVYTVIVDTGILLPSPVTNHPLAWSTLHDRYFRSWRYVRSGELNGIPTNFRVRPTIEQEGLVADVCCDLLGWKGDGTVKTELGQTYLAGRQGLVSKAVWNDVSDTVDLTLRYQY